MENQTYSKVTCCVPCFVDISDVKHVSKNPKPVKVAPCPPPPPIKKKNLKEIFRDYNKLVDEYIEKYN